MKASPSARALREHQTNADVVDDIMNFSRYGGLSQAFVMAALEGYSRDVTATDDDAMQTALLPAGVWKAIAAEVLKKLEAAGLLQGTAEPSPEAEQRGVATMVILHAEGGNVHTSYPAHRLAEAIALWREYISSGKSASLTVD